MHLWYLHQYFRTPEQGGAIRSYHLARAWVQAGHTVEVITAHNHDEYRQYTVEGIRVHALPVGYAQQMGLARRSTAFRGYVRAVLHWAAQQGQRPAGIYATSTPLTVGYLAYRLQRRYGIPYVFEVRDLWPDVPLQMLPPLRILAPWLRHWERKIYRNARGVVALSPPMEGAIRQRAPQVPTLCIPNLADGRRFRPQQPTAGWRKRWQVPAGKRVLAYTGSLGRANAPRTLLAWIAATQHLNVHWVLVGAGSYYPQLKEACREYGHLTMLGEQPTAMVADLLGGADMAVVTFQEKCPVLGTNSPNKLFDALAAGCMVLTNRPGWYTDIITRAGAGMQVDEKTLPMLLKQCDGPGTAISRGQMAARQLAHDYDAGSLCQQWQARVEEWLR